jgi:type IV pilus assembly protein PilB
MRSSHVLRIGEILVEKGVITPNQRDEILEIQKRRGRPFGDLAERLFGVRPEAVEDAWARQYAQMADHVDARRLRPEPAALQLVTPRHALQFGVLPVELSGDEVMICTAEDNLPRALRFISWKVGRPAYFVIADLESLERAIQEFYGIKGAEAA